MSKPFSYEEAAAPQTGSFSYEDATGEAPKPAGMLRKVADKGLGFASGAVGATKAIADAAGAGNAVSGALGSANEVINDYLSPEAKADQQEQSAIMDSAKGQGLWEGVRAGARAFGVAPVQTAVQGLGSIVPVLAGGLAGLPGAAATGIAMGAGTAKGAIYDRIKKEGGTDEAATAAQDYTGANADQIALGGALGVADALTGVSRIAGGMVRNAVGKPIVQAVAQGAERGVLKRAGMGMLGEMPLEAAQGGQEQVAANLAAQRAGYKAGTWDNVASNATLEALASAGPGAVFGALDRQAPAKPATDVPQVESDSTPPADKPLQIGNTPDPMISFADGTVGRQSEVDKYINGLPPDQQPAARAKLMGLAPQPAKPSESMGLTPTAAPSLTNAAILAVDSGVSQPQIEAADPVQAAQDDYRTQTAALLQQQDEQAYEAYMTAIEQSRVAQDEAPGETITAVTPIANVLADYDSLSDDEFFAALGATPEETQDAIANQPSSPQASVANPAVTAPDVAASAGEGAPAVDAKAANLARIQAANRPQPTTLGTQTNAVAGPGFGVSDVVKKQTQDQAEQGPVATDGVAKEPWKMTREEYAKQGGDISYSAPQGSGSHREAVEDAVARGEKIPAEVLDGYPWLAADENIKPYSDGLRNLSDKELSDEEKRVSAALNKWSKDVPTLGNTGGKLHINPQLHSVDSFEISARFNAVSNEIDRRKGDPNNTPAAPTGAPTRVASTPELSKKEQAKADLDHLFGVDSKRAKAIERIAKGTAYFSKPLKAQEFIAKNGLKETHQSVKTARGWDIVAKSQPTENASVTQTPVTQQTSQEESQPQGSPTAVTQPAADAGVAAAGKAEVAKPVTPKVEPEARAGKSRPTVNEVARSIQLKVAQNRLKHRQKLRKEREAKGYAPNSTAESEQADYEKEISAAPMQMQLDSASRLIGSDPEALIGMFVNGNYEASEDVFKEITGVKIRGLSAADKKAALYKWANWTPEQIAEAEARAAAKQSDRQEKSKQKDFEYDARVAWAGLGRLQVKDKDGKVMTGQEFVLDMVSKGFNKTHTHKKGIATVYSLTDGARSTNLKNKDFNAFVKAAIGMGGLDKALSHVKPVMKAPDGFVDRSIDTKDSAKADAPTVEQVPAKAPEVAPERTATEHAGVKIYPITFKNEPRWAVQSEHNRSTGLNKSDNVLGDTIHATLEEAKAEAERQVVRVKSQAERTAAAEAEKAAAQAKKDANKGKSIVERRKEAILDGATKMPVQAGLGNGTKRESMQKAVDQERAIVEKMVDDTAAKKRDNEAIDLVRAKGFILGLSNENLPVVKAGLEAQARLKANDYKKPSYRVHSGRDTNSSFYEISKTEYDYAQELKAQPKDPRENYIRSAADSIGQLRKSDVDRVLNGLAKDNIDGVTRADLAAYIKEKHPDYAQEVDDVMAEIEGQTASKVPSDLLAGDRFKDAKGNEFQVWSARQGRIEAHPVVDGKPVVNRDSVQRWATTDAVRGANPEYRTDIVMQPTVASPVHQDPGKAPEVATAPVVSRSIAKAASNEDKSQKEMRLWLLGEIDKAVKLTEDYADYQQKIKEYGQDVANSVFYGKSGSSVGLTTAPGSGMITFDVPGDGKFKIRNSLRGLMEFRAKVEGKSGTGFTDKPTKPKGLPASTGVAKGSSNQIEALSNMLEELDFEAAVDYARETGVSLNDAKVAPHIRDQLNAYLKDGTLPLPPFSPSRYWEYQAPSRADKDGNPIREASLTKEIGADTFIANVSGTNATGFTFTVTKGAEAFEKKSGTFRTFSDALQGAESKINSIQPEVVKPKDTGWNMAGVGFAGKRYRGRNITLDDGREVVARIYENAGQYEEAEVKVDGVRKFAKTDRYKAEKLADDFIATLTAKEQATDKLDLKGFTRTPTGNGSFNLTDGNMMVTVEPTSYGFQASHGSSAKSGPRLTEQQAIEWAAALRDESKRIQAREAKPAEPAKTFRNPDTLNVLHAPIEDKDWFKLKNGEEWQARQGYSGRGWSLVRNGNLHPEARNFDSQSDFIRSVIEVTGQTQAAGQVVAPVEANDESIPAVTESQARKQFEWRNMGQKDGTKSHRLFFFESPDDKGTGRAMGNGEVSLYPGASGWKIEDGDGTSYKSLADAKAAAIDAAIPVLQEQGYILKPAAAATAILDAANITGKERVEALKDVKKGDITPEELEAAYPASAGKFEQHNAIAQEYGYTVGGDGAIALATGKESGLKVVLKGKRFQVRSKSTDDIVYSGATVDSMGKFLESFWGAEKEAKEAKPAAPAAQATEAKYTGPSDVSTRAGQMELANRAGRIASLKAMNDQLRQIAPNEAWEDANIESANDLDALQDQISAALVAAVKGTAAAAKVPDALRTELEEMSGAELKAIFEAMNLAGKNLMHSERVDMLMAEDAAEVRAAIAKAQPAERKPKDRNEADANIQNGNATRELTSFMKDESNAVNHAEKVAEWRKQYAGNHAETIAAGDISRSDYEKLSDLVRRGGVTEQRAIEMIESAASAGVLDKGVADNMRKKVGAAQEAKPAKEAKPAAQEQANDRDHFTLERLNQETNSMEPVTFTRGEYVRHKLGTGEIDGISQAKQEFSVEGIWYPFGYAYKAERPEAPKADTIPMSEAIDSINRKNGQGLTDADRVPASILDAEAGLWARITDGTATLDEFKAGFARWADGKDAIIEALSKNTKDQLLKMRGLFYDRYKNEPKAELVDAMWRDGVTRYVLARSFSHGMGKNAWMDGVRNMVESTDANQLKQYATEVKAEREEAVARGAKIAEAIKDPQTLDDYKTWMRATMTKGKTFKESRMMLTPGQRATFDDLVATESRGNRKTSTDAQRTSVSMAGQAVESSIIATKHTKKGHDLFVVQLGERVSKEDYSILLAGAKRIGGYYSAFRGGGAIPGFQFTERSQAEAFEQLANGDSTAAQEAAQANRDAFIDDRSQTATQRLTEMADRLEEQADSSLNQERKQNTDKRARQAASAEAAASADKAMAKTMRNLAQAIGNGSAKFLDRVRQKTQVSMLLTAVNNAKSDELRAKYPAYSDQERHKGEPATAETADYAEYPTFTAYRSDLASLARQLVNVEGTKKLGQQLLKVADDVSDAYLKFAKENFSQVASFSKTGGGVAGFSTKDAAEAAIARSGYKGKAIAYQVKRGEHTVIMSPSEAIERGIWKGDGDKRITLSGEFGADLVEKIGKAGRRGAPVSVPWQLETAHDRRKVLERMGIETPAEYRAALREFIGLHEVAEAPNKVKQLERAMIGRSNDGMDFFPTPESVADEMVEAAGIEPGMAVLEPSAGWGHIAERIRAAGVDPDVGEMSNDRQELLEAKGFNVVGRDFLNMSPRGFTYGDVFKHADGRIGILGSNGGLGSSRYRLIPMDGDGRNFDYVDREDLIGIEQRGSNRGYDRILMNPPFSDGRDIQHVQHAYSLLRPGGRIVAIMGESAFTNQNKRATEFREWLDSVGGTSEKLAEGSFNDPSLPVNTGANARMVVIEKSADSGDAKFSQGLLSPASFGPKPTPDQIQRLVDKVLKVAKNVIPVSVIGNPSQIAGIRVPTGAKPKGALIDGRIYLFSDNIQSIGDAYVTLFHELFHLGLQKVIPAEDYAAMLRQFSRNVLVQKFVREWKASPEGVEKAATMPSAAYEALAAEEAMAMISEELSANSGVGTRKLPGLVKTMLSWFAGAADRLGFPVQFGVWIRKLTQNAAEKFVTDMVRASMGGDKILGKTQAKYGAQAAEMTAQTRLSAGGRGTNEAMTNTNVVGSQGGRSADDTTPGARAARQILDAIEQDDDSVDYALRVIPGEFEGEINVGDILPASKQWADGNETTERLNGTSAVRIKNLDEKSILEALRNLGALGKNGPNGYYFGNRVALVKGESVGSGEDIGESIIDGAEVVGVWKKPTQGLSEIQPNESTAPDSGGVKFSQGLGNALNNAANNVRDGLNKATVTDLKHQFGNRLADFRGLGLQTLGRRQLVDLYAGDLPQMESYSRMVAQMDADKNESGAEADALATGWGKLKDERQLAELMHDATLAQIDPDKAFVDGDDQNFYDALRDGFTRLTPEAKAAYRKARDMYSGHNDKVRDAIRERIMRSEMSSAKKQALLTKMDGEFFKKVKGVYFPLARFGQYVTIVKDSSGNVLSANRSETMNEAEATRKILLAKFPASGGYKVGKVLKDKEFNAARDGVGRGFMADLFETLDKTNAGDELTDAISQLYLAALPDLSWAKHGIHRKGTPGFSQDARRAFAQNMFHGARYLAKLRYADQLQTKLDDMQEHIVSKADVAAFDSVKAQQVVDEMVKRHDSMMNPATNPISTALTSFGFVFHLGLSPASALVNLSQTALVAYPVMGAKWGFGKASAALMNASRQAAGNKNDISKALSGEELEAYNEAVRAGVIDVTMAHDLAGIAQGEDSKVSAKIRPVMKAASFLFHHAEKFNRQVTFVAAYRLAKESGAGHLSAYDQAVKATYDGHFDYSASNRPRVMQGNVAKVVLLFKQYAQNMVYTLTRQAQLSLNGATPAERAEARKALGGLLVSHALAAGALGLPMVGMLLSAASMIGGDDDEPWDAKAALQNMLADTLGQKPAEVFAHGLSRLTPWDISGRVGLDKLLLPDVQEGLEGADAVKNWMAAALGPVAGIAVNAGKGMQDIANGQYARGLESMLPSALRAPLKAYRYGTEGNIDKTGVAINEEIGAAGVAGQALGFSPSEARLAQEGKSAIYSADRAIQERRSSLTRQFALAAMAKDTEGMADARKDIARFNEKNPKARITPINLMQSVRARRKRIEQAEQGVYLPKKRQDAIDAGRFAVAE